MPLESSQEVKQQSSKKPFDRVKHMRRVGNLPRTESQKIMYWWNAKREADKSSMWKREHREVVISTDEPDQII